VYYSGIAIDTQFVGGKLSLGRKHLFQHFSFNHPESNGDDEANTSRSFEREISLDEEM